MNRTTDTDIDTDIDTLSCQQMNIGWNTICHQQAEFIVDGKYLLM